MGSENMYLLSIIGRFYVQSALGVKFGEVKHLVVKRSLDPNPNVSVVSKKCAFIAVYMVNMVLRMYSG